MAKKEAFEKQFKHVWGSSSSSISFARLSVDNKLAGEKLLHELFNKTLASDTFLYTDVSRKYKSSAGLNSDKGTSIVTEKKAVIHLVTGDDRVAELIEEAIDLTQNENLDISIMQFAAASTEYINWSKL